MKASFLALLLAVGPAFAQSVSLEDLTAQIEAETGQIAGFRALLTDPDPNKALAAMRAMMGSGDPMLVNLALEAGLTSNSGVMRKTALEHFIAARPNLVAKAELVGDESDPAGFSYWLHSIARGSNASERTGFVTITVGPYSEEAKCHLVPGQPHCGVKAAGGDIAVLIGSSWAGLELVEGGLLKGSISDRRSGGPITLTIDLLGAAAQ